MCQVGSRRTACQSSKFHGAVRLLEFPVQCVGGEGFSDVKGVTEKQTHTAPTEEEKMTREREGRCNALERQPTHCVSGSMRGASERGAQCA